MARVVLIVDSDTGKLIDVAGNTRESGRYYKFAGRMLSIAKNPTLDYGINGGDTLTIAKGTGNGELVNIKANKVKVFGELDINGRTVQEIAAEQTSHYLDRIDGTPGEVDVEITTDESGKSRLRISLDSGIAQAIQELSDEISGQGGALSKYVKKSDLAEALEGISDDINVPQEEINAQFAALVRNLKALSESGDSDSSSSPSE